MVGSLPELDAATDGSSGRSDELVVASGVDAALLSSDDSPPAGTSGVRIYDRGEGGESKEEGHACKCESS